MARLLRTVRESILLWVAFVWRYTRGFPSIDYAQSILHIIFTLAPMRIRILTSSPLIDSGPGLALREFWRIHPDAEVPLRGWYAQASRANWRRPADVRAAYRNASFIANGRVVFNIKGNDYRLVVAVHYNRGMMFVRFVGTHREYDRIDAATI